MCAVKGPVAASVFGVAHLWLHGKEEEQSTSLVTVPGGQQFRWRTQRLVIPSDQQHEYLVSFALVSDNRRNNKLHAKPTLTFLLGDDRQCQVTRLGKLTFDHPAPGFHGKLKEMTHHTEALFFRVPMATFGEHSHADRVPLLCHCVLMQGDAGGARTTLNTVNTTQVTMLPESVPLPSWSCFDTRLRKLLARKPTDLTIELDESGTELKVQSQLLRIASPVLAMLLRYSPDCKDSRPCHFTCKRLEIRFHRGVVFQELLAFVSTGLLRQQQDVYVLIELLAAADEYQMYDLKHACQVQLVSQLTADKANELAQVAKLLQASYLERSALDLLYQAKQTKHLVGGQSEENLINSAGNVYPVVTIAQARNWTRLATTFMHYITHNRRSIFSTQAWRDFKHTYTSNCPLYTP